MVSTNNTAKYVIAIVIIGISSLLVLSLFAKHNPFSSKPRVTENPVSVPIEAPIVDFTETQDPPAEKPVVPVSKPTPKAEKKAETPSAPAPLQNNQATPPPTDPQPSPVIVNITTSPTTVIVNPPVVETPQVSMEKTYNITKGTEDFKQNQTEAQVREFAASLNNYVSWKKQMKSAALEVVFGALSSNGYAVQENN